MGHAKPLKCKQAARPWKCRHLRALCDPWRILPENQGANWSYAPHTWLMRGQSPIKTMNEGKLSKRQCSQVLLTLHLTGKKYRSCQLVSYQQFASSGLLIAEASCGIVVHASAIASACIQYLQAICIYIYIYIYLYTCSSPLPWQWAAMDRDPFKNKGELKAKKNFSKRSVLRCQSSPL